MIVAARAANEATPFFLVEKLEELFEQNSTSIQDKRVLVLGRSFKEDCPDTRNSKTFKMMDYLWSRGAEVFNFDPVAEDHNFESSRGTMFIGDPLAAGQFDAIVVTLSHSVFYEQFNVPTLAKMAKRRAPLIDMRGMFDCEAVEDHFNYWRP
jgi:UDP-N-acetyl-D-galactosamine dehydrogenase